MEIQEMQRRAFEAAERKGFHIIPHHESLRTSALVRLALIHTAVSQATQEVKRHAVPDDPHVQVRIAAELADVLIRCADLAHMLRIDLEAAVRTQIQGAHVCTGEGDWTYGR